MIKSIFVALIVAVLLLGCDSEVFYPTEVKGKENPVVQQEELLSDSVLVEVIPNAQFLSDVSAYIIRVDYGTGYGYQPEVDALYRGASQEYVLQFYLRRSEIIGDYANIKLSVLRTRAPHPGYIETDVMSFRVYR